MKYPSIKRAVRERERERDLSQRLNCRRKNLRADESLIFLSDAIQSSARGLASPDSFWSGCWGGTQTWRWRRPSVGTKVRAGLTIIFLVDLRCGVGWWSVATTGGYFGPRRESAFSYTLRALATRWDSGHRPTTFPCIISDLPCEGQGKAI